MRIYDDGQEPRSFEEADRATFRLLWRHRHTFAEEVAISAFAELSARHRSDVIREAIAELVTRRERERYLAAYRAEAKVGYCDPVLRAEALALAEDAIAVDNEALEKAESDAARPNASDETPWWR